MHTTPKRRRLNPEERINEILDAATKLVLSDGTKITMEKIAHQAGASKALLYSYFSNVSDLLKAVYQREHEKLQTEQLEALRSPHSFEDMVVHTERVNREHHHERQQLVRRLQAVPDIQTSMQDFDRRNRRSVEKYIVAEITNHFAMTDDIALTAARLALGYDIPGANNKTDEIWGAMMVGAMAELEKRYTKDTEDD